MACEIKKRTVSEIFPEGIKRERYMNFMNSLVGNVMREFIYDSEYYISDITDKKFIDEVYTKVSRLIINTIALDNGETKDEDGNPLQVPLGLTKKTLPSQEILLDFLDILENYNIFTEYHKSISPIFKYNDLDISKNLNRENDESNEESTGADEGNELSVDERSIKIDEYDRSANSQDDYSMLHKDVKLLFNLLTSEKWNSETESFEYVLDNNNLPILASANNIYNRFISKANNFLNEEDLLNFMTDINNQKIIPEIRQIAEILNIQNWNNRTQKQKELWINFHTSFSLPAVNIESLNNESKGRRISREMNSDIRGNKDRILDRWANNFESRDIRTDLQSNHKDGLESSVYIEKKHLIEPITSKSSYDFLEQIGFKFSTDLFEEDNSEDINKAIVFYSKALYKELPPIVTNVVKTLNKGKINPIIAKLVEIESRYNQDEPSNSSLTAAGERQYLIAQKTNISIAVSNLNQAKSREDLLNKDTFRNLHNNELAWHSIILDRLFKQDGTRNEDNKISFNIFSGHKKDGRGKMMRDFTPEDKLIFDFESMLRFGRSDIMRTETSNTFFSIGLATKGNYLYSNNNQKLYFEISNFNKGLLTSPIVQNQILRYLEGEIDRIKSYPEKKKENPTLTEDYGEFNIFHQLDDKLKDKLKTEPLTEELKKEVLKNYSDILKVEFNSLNKEMLKIGNDKLISNQMEKLGFDAATLKRAYFMNSLFQNIEFGILFSGDPLFFNTKSEFHKRNKQLSSPGTYTNISNTANEVVRNDKVLNDFNLSQLYKAKLRNNSDSFLTQTVKDIKASEIKGFYKEYLKDGSDYEITDGQGIISPDFLQEILIRQGFRNEYTDIVFEYQHLFAKSRILNIPLTVSERNRLALLQNKIDTNPDLYALPIMKGGYSGTLLNISVDGRAYDKFSLMPLLPTYVVGNPKLEKLLKDMLTKQYGYIKYASGSKGFKTESVSIENLDEAIPDEYITSLYKTQIQYSNEQSTDTSIPTQLVKLILSNQFNNGKPKDKEAQKLYDSYKTILSNIQNWQRAELKSQLGIEEGKPINFKKLSDKLVKEARRRGMSSNVLTSLEYNESTGKLNTNTELIIPTEIEKLLTSVIDKTLRRFKLNGGDYVMISNGLRERLNFYKKGKSCECRISFGKGFLPLLKLTHPDGSPIQNSLRLNEAVKDKKWRDQHKDHLTIVLDRVPTQELNSMDSAIIVEFLPSTMGNVIQLPEEIVVKAGSDFDYDKEKVIIPTYTPNGSFKRSIVNAQLEIDKLKKERKEKIKLYYDKNNKDETIEKIRNYINDISIQLNKGNFDYIKETKDTLKLKELFESITNLEIAKIDLDKMISVTNDYEENHGYLISNAQEKFMSEEINELRESIDILTEEFDTQLSQFKKNELFDVINEGYRYRRKIGDLYDQMENQLGNFSNEILQLYSQAILKKDRFEELVKKNSVEELKALAKSVGEHIGYSTNMPSKDKVFYPNENLKVFNIFFNAKNMLAPYAKTNTLQQLFAYLGTKINTSYIDKFSNKSIALQHKIITQSEINKFQKGDKIYVGNNKNIKGENKQLINSQAINGTVDSAKDPWFASLMLNYKNIGIDILMGTFFGIPQETIKAFLTNKGLLEILDLLNNGATNADMRKFIVDRYGLTMQRGKKIVPMSSYAKDLNPFMDTLLSNSNPLSYDDLLELSHKDLDLNNLTEEQKQKQLTVIAQFLNYQNYNYAVSNINRYLNFDTAKVGSLLDLKKRQNLRKEILRSNIISEEELNKLENESIISYFKNDDIIQEVFDNFMPVISKNADNLYKIYDQYLNDFENKNKKGMRNLPSSIERDFIFSIVQNFGNLAKNGYELLTGKTVDDLTIKQRLINFKRSSIYKELSDNYPILNQLISSVHFRENDPEFYNEVNSIQNIQYIKSNNTSLSETELGIYQFSNLMNVDNENVKRLIKDIMDIGLAQSGMSDSFISYRHLIPISYYREDYENALNTFESLSEQEKWDYSYDFANTFKNNNPQYFKVLSKNEDGSKNYNRNNSSQRVKFPIKIKTPSEKAILPSKTESGNVVIKSVYQKAGVEYAKSIGGIFSMRLNNTIHNFGNPFGSDPKIVKREGLIQTNSTRQAVNNYIDWITTDKFKEVEPERRQWIIEQLQSGDLKNKPIVYYKELNQPSHANALDYLINQYNWNQNQSTQGEEISNQQSSINNRQGENQIREIQVEQSKISLYPDDRMFDQNGKEVTNQVIKNKVNIIKELQDGTLRKSEYNKSIYFVTSDNRVMDSGESNLGKESIKNKDTVEKILAKAVPYKSKNCN